MKFPVRLLILVFSLTYYLAERTGLFGVGPLSSLDVLYSMPILSASVLFLIVTLISAVKHFRNIKTTGWLLVITVILIISGLWLSYLTRFSGEVVLTEGQMFYSGHNDYIPETFYRGRFSTTPDTGMKLEKIQTSISDDNSHMKGLEGKFQLIGKDSAESRNITVTDGVPTMISGTFFKIRDFGYSIRYALKSAEGRLLDSSFIYMKLFPPGSEDSFRLLSPLTYYVRYYPEDADNDNSPLVGLRIVRNKDIVYNGKVKLSEDVSFENSRISIEEVRMWTKLYIVRDWGVIPAFCGLILGLIALVIRGIKTGAHDTTHL
jgi:hypothetical protein